MEPDGRHVRISVAGSWRWQPPVHSPLSLGALARSMRAAVPGIDPLSRLGALLAREYAADGALLTDSGTSALQLGIRTAVALTGTDTVGLPAYCCYDVATAAVGAGVRIMLYDVDPATLGPDLDSLEQVLAAGAGAAVVAPLYGIPVDWDAVTSVAAAHDAVLVEDAAQGHGATWRGLPLGSLGRLSILSFGRGKGWTGGGGGALLWRGMPEGPRYSLPSQRPAASARLFAAAAAQWALGRPALYGLPASVPALGLGETRYRDPVPPRAMSDLAADLALNTASAALAEAARRRTQADRLLSGLPTALTAIDIPAGGRAGYLRLPVRVPSGSASFVRRHRRAGVAGGYPTTLADLVAVRQRGDAHSRPLPGAMDLVRELATLPTHGLMAAGDIDLLLRDIR